MAAKALSVTCGDSSPRGRAKLPAQPPAAAALPAGEPRRGALASPFGRGGRAKQGRRGSTVTAKALSVACGGSSPSGRAKLPSQPPAAAALPEGEPGAMNCFISFPRNQRRRRHRRRCCSGCHRRSSRGIPRSGRCVRRPRSGVLRAGWQPRPSARDPWI